MMPLDFEVAPERSSKRKFFQFTSFKCLGVDDPKTCNFVLVKRFKLVFYVLIFSVVSKTRAAIVLVVVSGNVLLKSIESACIRILAACLDVFFAFILTVIGDLVADVVHRKVLVSLFKQALVARKVLARAKILLVVLQVIAVVFIVIKGLQLVASFRCTDTLSRYTPANL
jgi:uncharacterized membrane protein